MAKTTIKGRFATAADVANLHQISAARQQWLDRQVNEAIAEPVILFTPLDARKIEGRPGKSKRVGSTRSGKIVGLSTAKKK